MIQNLYLLTVYEKIKNKKCTNIVNAYETLEIAKDVCSNQPECEMLYDNNGSGQSFLLCKRPTELITSSEGSVVYIKPGRKYICTRTNSMGIFIFLPYQYLF